MGFLQTMSELSNYYFAYLLLVVVFVVPLTIYIKREMETLKAIHLSAFYTVILSIIFYVSEIITSSRVVFICAIVYGVSAGLRWYHHD